MEAFQAALDDLQRESKEQITNVQEKASAAVLQAHVVPHRIAVATAQRFTGERIATAYPVLCFLDATLVRTSTAAAAAGGAPPSPADQALAAFLKEFWELAPGVLTSVHTYGNEQPAWREKCIRLVRRWKQRKSLSESLADALLTAMEKGVDVTAAAEEEMNTEAAASASPGTDTASASPSMRGAEDGEVGSSSSPSTAARPMQPPAVAFTSLQAQRFRAALQSCMSALESLPAARAALYLELIRAQHFRTPTKTALLFFEELLADLRREVTAASTPGGTGHIGGGGGEGGVSGVVGGDADGGASAAGHAREALGKFLDQLHNPNADGAGVGGGGGGHGRTGGAGGGPGSSSATHTAATTVVRYVSPIFSDIYAKQPLGQRGHGFGILQRKAGHGGGSGSGGSSNNSFYTSYYPKPVANAQRPFRIPPTKQAQGGAVRLWFPRPQEWVAVQDMADLPQYAGRSSQTERDRKRTREDA